MSHSVDGVRGTSRKEIQCFAIPDAFEVCRTSLFALSKTFYKKYFHLIDMLKKEK